MQGVMDPLRLLGRIRLSHTNVLVCFVLRVVRFVLRYLVHSVLFCCLVNSCLIDVLEQTLATAASDCSSLSDRGCNRQRSALSVLSAMSFAAAKLDLSHLQAVLGGPLIEAWKRKDCWRLSRAKEALPLPLESLRLLECAFLEILRLKTTGY